MRRRLSAVAIASMCAGPVFGTPWTAGCGRPSPTVDRDGTSASARRATEVDAGLDQVLAHVGDDTITLGDYLAVLEHMDEFDRLRYRAPERRRQLLSEMIDVTLLAQEAREQGYDRDPATQEELNAILRDAMLKKAREGAPTPNEIPAGEVRAYYDAHKADFHDPERRRVSVIALSQQPAAEAVLRLAQNATPEGWGQLARTRSTDPAAKSVVPIELAGDLGFVGPPGDSRGNNVRVPEAVRQAVFEVAHVGDVVPHVVSAGSTFYVVKLAAKSDAHDRSFDDAQRNIRVKLAEDKARQRELALLDDLRKQFPVEIDDAALAGVHVERVDASAADVVEAGP